MENQLSTNPVVVVEEDEAALEWRAFLDDVRFRLRPDGSFEVSTVGDHEGFVCQIQPAALDRMHRASVVNYIKGRLPTDLEAARLRRMLKPLVDAHESGDLHQLVEFLMSGGLLSRMAAQLLTQMRDRAINMGVMERR